MIYAKSLPTTSISDYRASNDMSTIKELHDLKGEIRTAIYDKLELFAKDSSADIKSFYFDGLNIDLDQYGDCKVEFRVSVQIGAPKKGGVI